MSDETLPKNKLNIKSDLQNFWKDKDNIEDKEIKGEEMAIKNDWVNNDKYKNKKTNFNLNYNDDNEDNKSKIILTIITIVAIYFVYEIYSYIQTEKQNKAVINQQIIEYNKQVLEKQKALNYQNQTYNQNKNYSNYKYFKVSYETTDNNYDYNFIYNINTITNNLSNLKSRSDDNNYDIEIVGNISKYGDFFYRIYKRKTSNEYNEQVTNMLSELKKIRFKTQKDMINFKIYVNNNSYDLNYK